MPENPEAQPASLSPQGFFLAAVRLAHTRLQILSTDFAEERARLTLVAMSAAAALFCLALAIVMGSLLLVVLFWETHRVVVLALLAVAFALLGAGLLAVVFRSLRGRERPFQATLAELEKDRDAWRAPRDIG